MDGGKGDARGGSGEGGEAAANGNGRVRKRRALQRSSWARQRARRAAGRVTLRQTFVLIWPYFRFAFRRRTCQLTFEKRRFFHLTFEKLSFSAKT